MRQTAFHTKDGWCSFLGSVQIMGVGLIHNDFHSLGMVWYGIITHA